MNLYFEGISEIELDSIYDGVLEPFSIREQIKKNTKRPDRSVKGSVMGGNEDRFFSSPQILQVDYYDLENKIEPFDETMAFSDNRFEASFDDTYENPLGETDSYISGKKRSGTAGWVYGFSSAVGTDSIAFGDTGY